MSGRRPTAAGRRATGPASQALEKELGDKIEITFLENVPEGPDAERAIEGLARAGNKLIFTTSFGFMDPTIKVAAKYPGREVRARHRLQDRAERHDLQRPLLPGPLHHRPDRGEDVEDRHSPATSSPSRSPKWSWASTRSCSARSRSIRTSSSRSSGSTPGWTRPRKATPPRRCSTRAPTSSPSTPTRPRRCKIAEERGLHGFGQAHDMIDAAPKAQLHRDHRQLGPVLHRAAPRRCSTAPGSRRRAGTASRRAPCRWRPTPTCRTTSPRRPRTSRRRSRPATFHPFTGPIFKQDGTEVIAGRRRCWTTATLLSMN